MEKKNPMERLSLFLPFCLLCIVLIVFPFLVYYTSHNQKMNINVVNITYSGPIKIVAVKPVVFQNGLLAFSFLMQNTANYSVSYQSGCVSPIYGSVYYLGNKIGINSSNLNCNAIVELSLPPLSYSRLTWPYNGGVKVPTAAGEYNVYLSFSWKNGTSMHIEPISFDVYFYLEG